MHGIYKIMEIPVEMWKELDESYRKIVVNNLQMELIKTFNKDEAEALYLRILEGKKEPEEVLKEWIEQQDKELINGLLSKLEANLVESGSEFIETLTAEASEDQAEALTVYLKTITT